MGSLSRLLTLTESVRVIPVPDGEEPAEGVIQALVEMASGHRLMDELLEMAAQIDVLIRNPVLAPRQLIQLAEPFSTTLFVERLSAEVGGHC